MKTRASLYTAEIADHILRELRAGRSLHDICSDDGMPHRATVTNWVEQDREGFAARYRQARQIGHGSSGSVGYTAETAERFLGELMNGRTLVDVCGDADMPDQSTINCWVASDREGFAARYRSARQVGRLSRAEVAYTPETANLVLDELMGGRTLEDICADPDMPSAASVRRWVRDDREGFAARYREAREVGCHVIGDQMLRIVDDRRNDWITWRREDGTMARMLDPERVNRALARVKTRQGLLSRMLPRTFGDRPERTATQDSNAEIAEFMKLIEDRSRSLPGKDEPLDEG
jgi:hypothetical protein